MRALLVLSAIFASAVALAPDIVVLDSKREGPPVHARFSHWQHDELRCFHCHPAVFPRPPEEITHSTMTEGAACGACHDGRRATEIKKMRCGDCHVQ